MLTDSTIIVRGGGDLATGVIYRLFRAGCRIVVLELENPRSVRRSVSASQAIISGEHIVEGVIFRRSDIGDVPTLSRDVIPVIVDPKGASIEYLNPGFIVDARMLKRDIDSDYDTDCFVVGLGPGFVVGKNCDVVIETKRGHSLGKAFYDKGAQAIPDTGVPEQVNGVKGNRVVRAPCTGTISNCAEIGDTLLVGDCIAVVNAEEVLVQISGVLRGLIQDGIEVSRNEKIADVDPRNIVEYCYTISDKALAIGGGVLESILYGICLKSH